MNAKRLRIVIISLVLIYGGGVVFSYLQHSQGERAACYAAGGFWGRIWCPESADTEGIEFYIFTALGWPAQIVRMAAAPADNFEKAVASAKRSDLANFTHQPAEKAQTSIREAQRLLNTLGYKIGIADGVVGPRTRAAISDFQLRDGMQVSGEVTPELVTRLQHSVRNGELDAMKNE